MSTTISPPGKQPRGRNNGTNGKSAHAPSGPPLATKSEDVRLRMILNAIVAFRDGDFSLRLPSDWEGTEGQIAGAFNQAIANKQRISKELTRLSEMVGKQGREHALPRSRC